MSSLDIFKELKLNENCMHKYDRQFKLTPAAGGFHRHLELAQGES